MASRRQANNLSVPQWYQWVLAPPRFAPEAEADYLYQWRLDNALRMQRVAGLLASLMYISALSADYWVQHRVGSNWLFWSFAVVSLSMTLTLAFAPAVPSLRHRAYQIAFCTLLINGLSMIGLWGHTLRMGDSFPQGWLLVLIIYTFLLTGMPYRLCTPLGIGLGIIAIVVGQACELSLPRLLDLIMLMSSCVITGMIACSALERTDRLGWQRARNMQTQSLSDELTGLRNRRYLFDEGARRMADAGASDMPISLLMIDIDYFKGYNDSFGHPAGDRCLRKVAGSLSEGLRHPLDLCVRLGGEEFAVLLFSSRKSAAMEAADIIRARVEALEIAHPTSPRQHLTVSVGVASWSATAANDLDALLLAADKALYRAKASGRNAVSD